MIRIQQLLSVLALLPLVNEMADGQEVLEAGRFRHGPLRYMVEASYRQYSIEGVVVACYHCWSQWAYR